MSGKHNIFHGQFYKGEDGKLTASGATKERYLKFIEALEPNQTVEAFFEANEDNGTVPQLAKIHACIRELAKEIGEPYEDMKLEVKRQSGLCVKKEVNGEQFMVCKSFADCSKEELALTIEAINRIGDMVGINFR